MKITDWGARAEADDQSGDPTVAEVSLMGTRARAVAAEALRW